MLHRHIHRTYLPEAIYFVTTYVRRRKEFFRNPTVAKICEANMRNAFHIQRCVTFAYVIMPDHLHLLVQPSERNISELMRSIKTNTSRDINRYMHTSSHHNRGPGTSVMGGRFEWQSSFYDHVITDERDFRTHIEYIRYNPVKAGLVEKPEDYPFLYVDRNAIGRILAGV